MLEGLDARGYYIRVQVLIAVLGQASHPGYRSPGRLPALFLPSLLLQPLPPPVLRSSSHHCPPHAWQKAFPSWIVVGSCRPPSKPPGPNRWGFGEVLTA